MYSHLGFVGLVLVAVVTVSCSDSIPETTSAPATHEQIEGIWYLDAFELDGVEEDVEVGVNTSVQPWVEVSTLLTGSLGCNDFGSNEESYSLSDGVLVPGEVFQTLSYCLENDLDEGALMRAETAFTNVLLEPDGIQVRTEGSQMMWAAAGTKLIFTKVDAPPPAPTTAPSTSHGRLDCTPGVVATVKSDDTGQDPEQLVREADSTVVRVEIEPPSWWWGYDEEDQVTAAVAKDDVTPPTWTIYTCDAG
ncbi:MAG TPA: hypothetical protein VI193_00530 [Acidimicrobiia bacterium]